MPGQSGRRAGAGGTNVTAIIRLTESTMALFGSEKKQTPMAQQKGSVPQQINLVGEGTTFEGTLRADNDVRASGRIVGRLEVSGKAIVAESGTVEGEIVATNADIAGSVQGEVYIEDQLVLKSSARIDGTIQTGRLVVEEGALFTGECRMGQAANEPPTDRAVSESEITEERPPQPSEAAAADGSAQPVAAEQAKKGAANMQ